MKHNGYTNYETWTVASVIANERTIYQYFMNKKAYFEKTTMSKEETTGKLAEEIRLFIKITTPQVKDDLIWGPIINDIITERINYHEIAQTLIEK